MNNVARQDFAGIEKLARALARVKAVAPIEGDELETTEPAGIVTPERLR